jgi:hypothetical protein
MKTRFRFREIARKQRERLRIPAKFHETPAVYKMERTDKVEGKETPQADKEPSRFQIFRAAIKDSVKGIFRFVGYNVVGILPADMQRFIARKIFKDEKKANNFSNVSLATEGFLAISCSFGPLCSFAEIIPKIPHEMGGSMGKIGFFLLVDSFARFVYRDFLARGLEKDVHAAGSIYGGLIYNSIKSLKHLKNVTFDRYIASKKEELRGRSAHVSD